MLEQVESLDDPRVLVYRDLKRSNQTRRNGEFIVEGENLVRRLLRSDFEICSVLTSKRRLEGLAPALPANVPVLVAEHELVSQIVGYKFHSGVLACGIRKPNPSMESLAPILNQPGPATVLVCVHVDNPDNIGTILRTCSAFGVAAVILAEGCPDPFSRRVLRVSMGEAFWLPIRITDDLASDLETLDRQWGFAPVATVVDPDAQDLPVAEIPNKAALLIGNEAHGLDPNWVQRCRQRIRIPMHNNVDSLNVAVACGIFLYQFCRR